MKKSLIILLALLYLAPIRYVFAADQPDSYAKAYQLFSNITEAMMDKYQLLIEGHDQDLEYDAPDYLEGIIFLPFISIDMAFTSMLDESVEESAALAAFAFFGIQDASFTRLAANDYQIAYTSKNGASNIIRCVFSPENGALRYSRYQNDAIEEYVEFVPLGEDQYAMQSGYQRAVVTYSQDQIEAFTFSSTDQSLLNTGDIVYDLNRDGIYPSISGLGEAWVLYHGDLQLIIQLDESALFVKGNDVLGSPKEAVIAR